MTLEAPLPTFCWIRQPRGSESHDGVVFRREDCVQAVSSEESLKAFPEFDSFLMKNYKPAADFDSFAVYRRE